MRRFRSASVFVALVLALAVATQAAADEAPAEKRPIYVEVCVVEIDVAKLKAVGFEWEALYKTFLAPDNKTDDPVEPLAFMRALASANLARIQANPQLVTISGRPASLELGDKEKANELKVNLTPKIEGDAIRVEYRLQITEPVLVDEAGRSYEELGLPPGRRRLFSDAAVEVKPGRTHVSAPPPYSRTDAGGKQRVITPVLLIRAGFDVPENVRTAAKQPPAKATYREVPKR
jgi:hypothetical protein